MAFHRVEPAFHKFVVVFLDIAHRGFFQQIVAAVHLDAQRIEGVDYLIGIRDDRLVLVGQESEEMVLERPIRRELYLLGVYQYQFYLGGVFFIQDRHQDCVDTHRFTLTRGTGYQQVGHLCQICYKDFIGDGFAQSDGQVHFCPFEFFGHEDFLHGHHLFLLVRHFDTNSALARYGRDNADTEGRQAQGDIVFQVFDPGNAHARGGDDFVQRNRRANRCPDFGNFYFVMKQRLYDLVFVRFQFFPVDLDLLVGIIVQQGHYGIFVGGQVQRRVIRFAELLLFLRDGGKGAGSVGRFHGRHRGQRRYFHGRARCQCRCFRTCRRRVRLAVQVEGELVSRYLAVTAFVFHRITRYGQDGICHGRPLLSSGGR